MGTFLAYTLKSAFCLILFYPAYRLLLSRETFHRFNRIALLALLALSALLPLVTIGSALDLFGGKMEWTRVMEKIKEDK